MISDFPAIVDACVLVQAAVRDELHEQGAALNKPRTISEVLGSLVLIAVLYIFVACFFFVINPRVQKHPGNRKP